MLPGTYSWNWSTLFFILLFIAVSFGKTLPTSGDKFHSEEKYLERVERHQDRVKRSPFIMAFQVTKPPGMFSMSLRRPYFFNMISNMTRSLFSSNFSEMIRRGFGQPASNSTVVDQIRSRQEDLEIFEK